MPGSGAGAACGGQVGEGNRLHARRADRRAVAEQHAHAGVLGHERQALVRQVGVERHVARPGLQHAHHRHRQLEAAARGDTDELAGTDATGAQQRGDRVGARVERGVIHRPLAEAHRGPLRVGARHPGEDLEDGLRTRRTRILGAIRDGRLGGQEAAGLPERRIRSLRQPLQHADEAGEVPLDRHPVVEVGVVGPVHPDPVRLVEQVEEDLEVLERPRMQDELGIEPLVRQAVDVVEVVDVEDHRHQQDARRVARQAQRLDQVAVGVVLVVERVHQRRPHLAEELAEALGVIDPAADREEVHAVPDHALHAEGQLARRGQADHHVLLTGDARQIELERRQHQVLQRASLGLGDRAEPAGELRIELAVDPGAVHRLHRRPRPVGQQVHHRDVAAETLQPVGLVRLRFRSLLPDLLGGDEVHQPLGRRQRRNAAPGPRLVDRVDLAHQHADRPAVADDVVYGKHEFVRVRGDPHQPRAGHGSVHQVDQRLHLGLAERREPRVALGRIEAAQVLDRHRPGALGSEAQPLAVRSKRERSESWRSNTSATAAVSTPSSSGPENVRLKARL